MIPTVQKLNRLLLEELFAFTDSIETKAQTVLDRVNTLTQSILAKDFRGEHSAVWRAQNLDLISDKNSAEALLKRIQEDWRKVEQKIRSKKKMGRKK